MQFLYNAIRKPSCIKKVVNSKKVNKKRMNKIAKIKYLACHFSNTNPIPSSNSSQPFSTFPVEHHISRRRHVFGREQAQLDRKQRQPAHLQQKWSSQKKTPSTARSSASWEQLLPSSSVVSISYSNPCNILRFWARGWPGTVCSVQINRVFVILTACLRASCHPPLHGLGRLTVLSILCGTRTF